MVGFQEHKLISIYSQTSQLNINIDRYPYLFLFPQKKSYTFTKYQINHVHIIL
jgi:hypothetical protein